MHESHKRSLVKAVTYRAFGFVSSGIIGFVITGSVEQASMFAVADTVVKIFGYYFHERIWAKLNFGRPKPPDYEI